MKHGKYLYLLLALPFVITVVLYELLPLVKLLVSSFISDNGAGFTLENYATILHGTLYLKAIRNSIRISLLSTVCGITIAYLAAQSISSVGAKWRWMATSILNMVSNFAGVPLAFADPDFFQLCGRSKN